MGRPKGSKNKKNLVVGNVDEQLFAVEAEIAELTKALRAKKAERLSLQKAKAENAKIAAAKKLEEEKAALLDAFDKSGKSFDEIMEMLKGE